MQYDMIEFVRVPTLYISRARKLCKKFFVS